MNDNKMWEKLYQKANEVINVRTISPLMEAGGVGAAVLTDKGNIYVGVCIDTACSLGMCAERNAAANMITNGESKIVKLVAVFWDGSIAPPCGACREFLMQLHKDSKDIEILVNYENFKTLKLNELLPDWWGTAYIEKMKKQ